MNNKGFVIERSTNAITYEKIGWINGKGTITEESSYKHIDNFVQPEVVYYYRLRQTDLDGREKLSPVRQAKISGTGAELMVSPNPADNQIRVFVSGSTEVADITIINSVGQQVALWKKQTVGTPISLSVAHLTKGYYRVMIRLRDGAISSPLIIK